MKVIIMLSSNRFVGGNKLFIELYDVKNAAFFHVKDMNFLFERDI